MITINRKTTLNWLLSQTAFEAINKDSLVSLTRPLGTSVTNVNKMLAASEEMELLLPEVLGASPKSSANDWMDLVSNFWHNFGFDVPAGGKPLDTSFQFTLNDPRRQNYIDELVEKLKLNRFKAPTNHKKEGKEEKGEETGEAKPIVEVPGEPAYTYEEKEQKLAEYVMTEVKEEYRYRYGHPVNVPDYLAWRYCLLSGNVGNSPDVITREDKPGQIVSGRIQFYLTDEAKIAEKKAKLQQLRNTAISHYNKLVTSKDSSKLDNMCVAADITADLGAIKLMSDEDKQSGLYDIATGNPQKFVELFEDVNIAKIAEIKKFIMASLIRNIDNTSIYVDASNPAQVLGNTFNEVISYMAADINKAYVNELRLKMNSLIR